MTRTAFVALVLLASSFHQQVAAAGAGSRVVACERSVAELQCPPTEEIVIRSAMFGRTQASLCPATPHNSGSEAVGSRRRRQKSQLQMRCDSPTALHVVAHACQGRNQCQLLASTRLFGNPCPGVESRYLDIRFTCVPAFAAHRPAAAQGTGAVWGAGSGLLEDDLYENETVAIQWAEKLEVNDISELSMPYVDTDGFLLGWYDASTSSGWAFDTTPGISGRVPKESTSLVWLGFLPIETTAAYTFTVHGGSKIMLDSFEVLEPLQYRAPVAPLLLGRAPQLRKVSANTHQGHGFDIQRRATLSAGKIYTISVKVSGGWSSAENWTAIADEDLDLSVSWSAPAEVGYEPRAVFYNGACGDDICQPFETAKTCWVDCFRSVTDNQCTWPSVGVPPLVEDVSITQAFVVPGVEDLSSGFDRVTGKQTGAPVFQFTYCQERALQDVFRSKIYLVPDQADVRRLPECSFSTEARSYTDENEMAYEQAFASSFSQSSTESSSTTIGTSASGKIYIVDVSASAEVSFSKSESVTRAGEMKTLHSGSEKQSNSAAITETRGTCLAFAADIVEVNLHPTFVASLRRMSNTDDAKSVIRRFGTDAMVSATLGGWVSQVTVTSADEFYSKSASESQAVSSLDFESASSGSTSLDGGVKVLGFGADTSVDTESSESSSSSSSTDRKVSEESIRAHTSSSRRDNVIAHGGQPGAYGPPTESENFILGTSWTAWASTVDENPVPVGYQLIALCELVDEDFTTQDGLNVRELLCEGLQAFLEEALSEKAAMNGPREFAFLTNYDYNTLPADRLVSYRVIGVDGTECCSDTNADTPGRVIYDYMQQKSDASGPITNGRKRLMEAKFGFMGYSTASDVGALSSLEMYPVSPEEVLLADLHSGQVMYMTPNGAGDLEQKYPYVGVGEHGYRIFLLGLQAIKAYDDANKIELYVDLVGSKHVLQTEISIEIDPPASGDSDFGTRTTLQTGPDWIQVPNRFKLDVGKVVGVRVTQKFGKCSPLRINGALVVKYLRTGSKKHSGTTGSGPLFSDLVKGHGLSTSFVNPGSSVADLALNGASLAARSTDKVADRQTAKFDACLGARFVVQNGQRVCQPSTRASGLSDRKVGKVNIRTNVPLDSEPHTTTLSCPQNEGAAPSTSGQVKRASAPDALGFRTFDIEFADPPVCKDSAVSVEVKLDSPWTQPELNRPGLDFDFEVGIDGMEMFPEVINPLYYNPEMKSEAYLSTASVTIGDPDSRQCEEYYDTINDPYVLSGVCIVEPDEDCNGRRPFCGYKRYYVLGPTLEDNANIDNTDRTYSEYKCFPIYDLPYHPGWHGKLFQPTSLDAEAYEAVFGLRESFDFPLHKLGRGWPLEESS